MIKIFKIKKEETTEQTKNIRNERKSRDVKIFRLYFLFYSCSLNDCYRTFISSGPFGYPHLDNSGIKQSKTPGGNMDRQRFARAFLSLLCLALISVAANIAILAQSAAPLPKGVERITSVEGITEYRLPNGLKVLLFPDQTKQNITVNVTYLVGSRHENYGETGMAHLLEH